MQGEGRVYLVGSGPGAASLLTLRAKAILSIADVVIYDRLVQPRLLNYAPQRAKLIYVGKESGFHAVPQNEIQDLLLHHAREGKSVVRLKGGDPFVYGRGGEEAAYLALHQIPFEIVPGITSAVGVPAYAGIPVTHRDCASMFTVMTGHRSSGEVSQVAFCSIEQNGTIVVLMGVNHLETIIHDLLVSGVAKNTPVAIIQRGSWGNQKVSIGTVSTILEIARKENILPPAVIVVGKTVQYRESLSWFESLPFFGRRMLVIADTIREAREEADRLEANGAEVFDFAFERQAEEINGVFEGLFRALDLQVPVYIYFQTVLGVHFLKRAAQNAQIDWRLFANTHFLARDESVAKAICELNFKADITTCEFSQISSYLSSQKFSSISPQNSAYFLYEKVPYECSIREEFGSDDWLIEKMIQNKLQDVSLTSSPFYQLHPLAQPIAALVREWRNLEFAEKRVLSEVALQFFNQTVLPRNSRLEMNRTDLCEVGLT